MEEERNYQTIELYTNLLKSSKEFHTVEKEITIFDTAMRNHYENPIIELLSFFIKNNEKHELGNTFFKGIIQAIQSIDSYKHIENFGELIAVNTEQITENSKRIDLTIETETTLILVEIKVYHHQNNPFEEYINWGFNELQKIKRRTDSHEIKKLVTIVLSPEGKTTAQNWHGLSFSSLKAHIQNILAETMLDQGLGKWSIYARDFLLHLENFMDKMDVDMKGLEFVINNSRDIYELVKLQQETYKDIVSHINKELVKAFGEEYQPREKWQKWGIHQAIRFSNSNWVDGSDTVLVLVVDEQPMCCQIHTWLDKQTDDMTNKLRNDLSKSLYRIADEGYESYKRWWGCHWEFKKFDLEQITQHIIFAQKALHKIDLKKKEEQTKI